MKGEGASIKSFVYRVKDREGRPRQGAIRADSEEQAVLRLIDAGYCVLGLSVRPALGMRRGRRRRVRRQEITWFFRQLSTLLGAGVPLLRCLRILEEQAGGPSLRTTLTEVSRDLERGESLSGALAARERVFPPIAPRMIKSGEAGGVLEETLERLAAYLEKEQQLGQQVRNAALYPALLAFFVLGVIFFLIGFVLPRMTEAFHYDTSALPGLTRVLLSLGGGGDWLWFLVIPAIGLGLAWKWRRATPSGRMTTDRLLLALPVTGSITGKLMITRFAACLGLLVQSGLNIIEALEVSAATVGNAFLAREISDVQQKVRQGMTVADACKTHRIFDPLVIQMVSIGEETGKLDASLLKVAEYYEAEAERLIKSGVALLEPALIIIMALVVGLVVSGTILPMLDMMTVF